MGKTKGKAAPSTDNFNYPPHDGYRGGCKVAWHYYKKRTDALLAADVAKLEARWKEVHGYDFGYQVPGTIKKAEDYAGEWAKFNGMYEVCVP